MVPLKRTREKGPTTMRRKSTKRKRIVIMAVPRSVRIRVRRNRD